MPNPCRATPPIDPVLAAICTVPQSNQALNCILFNAPTKIQIVGAVMTDFATGTSGNLTLALDCRSFQIPLDTPGTFRVSVLINTSMGHIVVIAEDCSSNTPLFWVPPTFGNPAGPASDSMTLVVR